ncbi:hypothetical protein R1flu_019299 [Riccia fluitans]|uniref:Uncharacterized protein n=1 Tax=Riccia fluitans TaxID=41844 RepID=A0ABD1ZKG7_9MARC
MTTDDHFEANLDPDFDETWVDLLASFLQRRPCQQPPTVADSSTANQTSSNIDDSKEPSPSEAPMTGKCKRSISENTKFLVAGMTSSLKEPMETLGGVM